MKTSKGIQGTVGRITLGLMVMVMVIIAGCGTKSASTESASPTPMVSEAATAAPSEAPSESPAPPKELYKVTQVTNWIAGAERGGNYTALFKDFYKEAGLDMTLTSGGPGINASALVASGKAEFGMGSTDEILLARENGIPIVGIMAVYQTSPQGLLFHKGQDIKTFTDLNNRKVYVSTGAGYWEYMKKAYDLGKVTEMKYNFELASFANDPTSVVQCYITSEPFDLKLQGIETEYLLNADSGFNPYGNLMYTTEDMIKNHPEQVKAFVEATIKGWDYYNKNYKEIDPLLREKNPDDSLEKMEFSANAQIPLVTGGDAAANGIGFMTTERWEAMNKQLVDVKVLKAPQDVSKAFTTEFLPKK
jgi:NitT/TauT family transport system substrate-binding protein